MVKHTRVLLSVAALAAISGCSNEATTPVANSNLAVRNAVGGTNTGNGAPSGSHYTLNIIGTSEKNPNMRYGQRKSFDVTLTELADGARVTPAVNNAPANKPITGTVSNTDLGISMQAVPADIAQRASLEPAKRGVLVTDVVPLGPAYQKLGEQDVIYEVLYPGPRRPIKSVADLQSVLSKLKTGDYISLNVHSLAQGAGDRVVNIRIGG